MSSCLNCNCDCDPLMTHDNVYIGYIVCPSCGFKMLLQYDEQWNPLNEDMDCYFWLEKYE